MQPVWPRSSIDGSLFYSWFNWIVFVLLRPHPDYLLPRSVGDHVLGDWHVEVEQTIADRDE